MPPFPLRTGNRTVVAPATLFTSSYVAGNIVSTDEANALCIDVSYTVGNETSIQIMIEATNDPGTLTSGSNWYQQVTQSASGGTVTLVPAIYSMTASGLSGTQNFTILINPVKATGFLISAQATGGTPTGTYGITAYTGWV